MDNIDKGRVTVIVIIVILLLTSMLSTFIASNYYLELGEHELANRILFKGIGKLGRSAFAYIFFYKGKKWAKIYLFVSLIVSVIIGIYNSTLYFIVIAIVYILVLIMLIFSSNIKEFLEYQET